MHAIVPPHPGPVTAADQIGADVGLTLLVGIPVAAVTWYVGSYLFSRRVGRRVHVDVPTTILGEVNGGRTELHPRPAGFGTVLGILLLPLVLITLNTVASTLTTTGVLAEDSAVAATMVLVGQTSVALLVTVLVAIGVLGLREGRTRDQVQSLVDGALGPICSIILITGARAACSAVCWSSPASARRCPARWRTSVCRSSSRRSSSRRCCGSPRARPPSPW